MRREFLAGKRREFRKLSCRNDEIIKKTYLEAKA